MQSEILEKTAAELRREYQRKWRAENREKVRIHQQRYWVRKAAQALEELNHDDND